MLTSLKREIINTVCQSVGVSDPRAVAAIATIADSKFAFGKFGAVLSQQGTITATQEGTANGEPFKITVVLQGQIAEQIQTLLAGVESRTEQVPPALPALPMQPAAAGAATDFLG